jgi:pre-rRNA-processing protein TSR3
MTVFFRYLIIGFEVPRPRSEALFLSEKPLACTFLPTIVVRHPKENPKKCSIWPLRGRDDLVFLPFPVKDRPNLEDYIRLAAEGPDLSPQDQQKGLLVLDGSWRWAAAMERAFQDVPPRALRGFKTAYPRVSRRGTDPSHGLATVEALFIAYRLLGRPTAGLLDHYHWAKQFLDANGFKS